MTERGRIFCEEAYALGKMLDHSGWQRHQALPRNVTPSDIDMAFDNKGAILYCELSSGCRQWGEISNGQRELYQNCIRDRQHCAALCRHNVGIENGRKIDTRADVESFELMIWDCGPVYSGLIAGNKYWQRFVIEWHSGNGPARLRRAFLGRSVGLVKPTNGRIPVDSVDGADAVMRYITQGT